jgi:uncharacterized DUF497 family protein
VEKVGFSGLEWDDGNRRKCQKHGVAISEIEYVLTHAETLMMPDPKNTDGEPRFLAIGRTQKQRYTFVVFTPRQTSGATLLRPISARYMHRKEIKKYEQEIARAQER